MSTPLIPWETQNIPAEIQKEWNRRKKNVGLNFKKSDGWDANGGDWEKYKGPMTAWVRVCSNGMGRPEINKPGFILSGGKNFYQTYGVRWNNRGNEQVLGYTPTGDIHTLDNDKLTSQHQIHVPSPEIIKVETVIQKELFRRAWIHWTCFSPKQLEYMTPYFLVPKISVVLEFGWNHFNPSSLIDLTDKKKLHDYYFTNPYSLYNENVLKSNGNYDVILGIVTNFEWTVDGNKIHCVTEITSKDRLYSGVPISTIVAEKKRADDKKTEVSYFSNIRQICSGDFIKNLKSIATADSLDTVSETASNTQLLQVIRGGTLPNRSKMREEYWRGIFYGRDEFNLKKSDELDFKWTAAKSGDFDKSPDDDNNVWVNMGFLVELMNRSLALPSGTKDSPFFEVDVEQSVIGAHPNHISCDGRVLLIPNAYAPKYQWGLRGQLQNGNDGDYSNQYLPSGRVVNKNVNDAADLMWHANAQLTTVFTQGRETYRDNLDWVINSNRYFFECGRQSYAFPFQAEESINIKNRPTDGPAKYDGLFYGYFKDLYFNVKRFVDLVKDENIKTYVELYKAIFDDINRAGGNFWEFSLISNENTAKLIVVDNRMLPSGNNKSTPWYFDYMDADSIMQSIGFKPKMSDAQAFRAVFGETNNSKSKTVIKEENDLLDYQFDDRILNMKQDDSPTVMSTVNSDDNLFRDKVKLLQHFEPQPESYQFTIMVGDKPYFRRLSLPDPEMLNCLLDDHDIERNQRYTGIQPITVELPMQGIGGIRTYMSFMIRNLPNPYHHKDVAYRIVDVHHSIQDGKWNTVIKSGIIPIRGYIKKKLGITE